MRDLFGEIPVTWDEVWLWIEKVALIPRDSPRAEYYARTWNVPEKVRQAKQSGTFPLLTGSLAQVKLSARRKKTPS